jgi:hypothetical protein
VHGVQVGGVWLRDARDLICRLIKKWGDDSPRSGSTSLNAKLAGATLPQDRAPPSRVGIAFGPHSFRHATATTAALEAPAHFRLAAGGLNIASEVTEVHYNRAGQIIAVQRLADLVERSAIQ